MKAFSLVAYLRPCLTIASTLAAGVAAVPTYTLMNPVPGSTTTAPSSGASTQPFLSTDGRYFTFTSNSSALISGFTDNNEASQSGGAPDIFQRDLQTNTYTLVTHRAGSTSDGANSRVTGQIRASSDGRYVAFASDATDLVTGKGGSQHLYYWDRTTNAVTHLAAIQIGGLTMSSDGTWIAFYSNSQVPKNVYDSSQGNHAYVNATFNAYLLNRSTGAVWLVSHAAGNTNAATSSSVQSIAVTDDGRYVAFETGGLISGWDTVTGTYNGEACYVWDRQTDTFTLVTKKNDGSAPGGSFLNSPAPLYLSQDGRYVYFNVINTDADFGVPGGDSNGINDLYQWDRNGGSTKIRRFLFDVHPLSPSAITSSIAFSPNGRYMAFLSQATNLAGPDSNGRADVFRLDTTTSTVERVNVNSDGSLWTDATNGVQPASVKLFTVTFPKVDDSGNVIFVSNAVGLGFTDTNIATDIFKATFTASDTTKPTVVSVVRLTPAGQNLPNATTTVTFRVTYSEAVTGIAAARYAIEAVNGGTVTGTIGTPTSSDNIVWDVPVNLTGGAGEFRLKVVD